MSELEAPVGLVLSGGGGKGAYEIGCWSALRDLNIPIDAVAGTSVGALNAALIAQGDIDEAQKLWLQITARNVFSFKAAKLPVLALRLVLILGLAFYRTSTPSRRRVQSLFLGAAIFTVLVIGVPAIAISVASGYRSLAEVRVLLIWYGCVFVGVGAPIAGWFWMERSNLFVLDNQPLKATIQQFLDTDRVSRSKIDTFVTGARPIEYFDPDDPAYDIDTVSPGYYYHPYMSREYLPVYSKLNGKTTGDILQLLLISTSLPFGIFPNRETNDAGWLDGGLADNTPLQPLLERGCNSIIVIHLDHKLGRSGRARLDEIEEARVAQLQRKLEVWESSEENFRAFVARFGSRVFSSNWPEQVTKNPGPPAHALPRLVHIVPSRRLGGLLRGTLRFAPSRARWLMRLGYADATKAVTTSLAGASQEEEPARRRLPMVIGRRVLLAVLAVLVLLGLAWAVDLISQSSGIQRQPMPVAFGLGVVLIAVGSATLWLAFLWRALSEQVRDRLLAAAVATWLAGFLSAVHGMEGATIPLVVFDIALAGALLAILGAVVRSRWRSRRSKS